MAVLDGIRLHGLAARWTTRLAAAAAVVAGFGLAQSNAATENPTLEYAVKASYLFKFGPFIAWPPHAFSSAAAPFNVCVLGQDPFGAALDQSARGQTVEGHVVAVWRIQSVSTSTSCHVLFIGRSTQQSRAEISQIIEGTPVLTVTDERLGAGGGIIQFVIRQGRVRFGLDAARAQASGLAVSSKLQALAVPIQRGGGS